MFDLRANKMVCSWVLRRTHVSRCGERSTTATSGASNEMIRFGVDVPRFVYPQLSKPSFIPGRPGEFQRPPHQVGPSHFRGQSKSVLLNDQFFEFGEISNFRLFICFDGSKAKNWSYLAPCARVLCQWNVPSSNSILTPRSLGGCRFWLQGWKSSNTNINI